MANRFPLILDTTDGNKIKELPADDNLNLRENSIVNAQNITALGTIDAADIRVAGNRLVAQAFADLTDTPSSFVGSSNYFVKVKADGTGLEYRPLSDLGNIEIDTITVDTGIIPSADGVSNLGSETFKFDEVVANTLKGNLVSYNEEIVFDATTGKISYAALQGAPTFLSEFTDDIGFLRTTDLDDQIAGLFDEGQQFVTDIQGSVFGDDSTLLVDGIASKIVGDIDFGTTTGFIEGDDIVILPTDGNAVSIGTAKLLDTLTPEFAQGGAIGTEELPFNEANFVSVNVDNISTEAVNLSEAIGVAQLTAATDLEILAENRVKVIGGVPFKFASVSATEQLAIGAQEGDVIYNTTTNRLQMYQGSAWKDINGNVEATAGTSNFNDVVVAGNLTVQGTTTSIETTNTDINDNVITLNKGEEGTGVTAGTSGIEIERGSSANKSLVWTEDFGGKWIVTDNATFFADRIEANYLVGSLTVSTDNLVMGDGDITATGTLTVGGFGQVQIVSVTTDIELLPVGKVKIDGNLEVTGTFDGDVTGSVFGDDSTVIVDAVGNNLNANKLTVDTVESTSGLLLLSQAGLNMTASTSALLRSLAGNFAIIADGGFASLESASGSGSISVNGDTNAISIGSSDSVTIQGAANAPVNIGTGTSGTVTLGNGANTVVITPSTTLELDSVTVTSAAFDLTGNIDNASLTLGATDATTVTIGNSGSTTTINGIVAMPALVSGNITADDSMNITTASGDGNAISIGPSGTNRNVNIVSDFIRLTGEVITTINAQAGITGDLKGSVVADDSTVMIDGQSGTIVGPISSTTVTGATITANTSVKTSVLTNLDTGTDLNINVDGFINIFGGFDDGSGLSKIQLDKAGINYIELTTEPKTPANPADIANIAINATSASGDVVIGTAISSRNQAVTINNATVNGTLIGNANGAHTGTLTGDVTGSVFSDDSSPMVDATNYAMFSDTLTLTPLNAEPENPVNGMIAVADGTGWDPASNAKNTLVAYLGGAWVTVAAAA